MSYYDLKSPFAYGSAKGHSKRWLEAQPAYTLHKPVRRRFKRNQYFSKGIDDFWQADLADMSDLARENHGFRYLLFVIDVFSKYLWVFPLKSKRPEGVIAAFLKIGRLPNLLMTDKGTEFQNQKVRKFFKNINYYTSNNPDVKASVAERVIRTLKTKLYRYFTHKGTWQYIDVLNRFVEGYNNSNHRSIGMSPSEVSQENENTVRNRLYKKPNTKAPKYDIGDHVRIAKQRGTFQKGYEPQWSEEIFSIDAILKRHPVVYKLIDYYGERISGTFYEVELQRVDPIYRVERIIRRHKDQALVKWLGYPQPTWEPLVNVL